MVPLVDTCWKTFTALLYHKRLVHDRATEFEKLCATILSSATEEQDRNTISAMLSTALTEFPFESPIPSPSNGSGSQDRPILPIGTTTQPSNPPMVDTSNQPSSVVQAISASNDAPIGTTTTHLSTTRTRCNCCRRFGHIKAGCPRYQCRYCRKIAPGHYEKHCERNPYQHQPASMVPGLYRRPRGIPSRARSLTRETTNNNIRHIVASTEQRPASARPLRTRIQNAPVVIPTTNATTTSASGSHRLPESILRHTRHHSLQRTHRHRPHPRPAIPRPPSYRSDSPEPDPYFDWDPIAESNITGEPVGLY